jgi:hypothetical protein
VTGRVLFLAVALLLLAGCAAPAVVPAPTPTPTVLPTAVPETEEDMAERMKPTPTLVVEANGHRFTADLEDNASAEAFVEKLSREAITVELHDYGDFEKVGDLPWELPRSDSPITTEPGDVILYQGDQITVYYDVNSWNFTRLARIGNTSREELLSVLGSGDVTVTFWIEWSE